MQIITASLRRPWGLELQLAWLVQWLQADRDIQLYTQEFADQRFDSIADHVTVDSRPTRRLDPERPTLVAGYPATRWVSPGQYDRLSVLLENIPWGLYPAAQQKWIGKITAFEDRWSALILGAIKEIVSKPITGWLRRRRRRHHEATLQQADYVMGFDQRLAEPLAELCDVETRIITPWCPLGQESAGEPEPRFLSIGPHEHGQNIASLLEGHYLFINRLGQQRQDVSLDDPQPMFDLWQPGSLTLEIRGEGEGRASHENLAETYNIDHLLEFNGWPDPRGLIELIRQSVAVVEVPSTSDASVLPYLSQALGVPAIYTHRHSGLDSLVEGTPLSHPVPAHDPDAIGKALMEATRIGLSERQPQETLQTALDPANNISNLVDLVTAK